MSFSMNKPLIIGDIDASVKEDISEIKQDINALITDIVTLSSGDSITLSDNTIYNGAEVSNFTIVLPSSATVDFISEIDFSSGATATTVTYPNTINWMGDDVSANIFMPDVNKRYTIIIFYNGNDYVAVVKGV